MPISPTVSSEIVLINNTPSVTRDSPTSASVRVDFTLPTNVDFASCQLFDVFGPRNCTSQLSHDSGCGYLVEPQECGTVVITLYHRFRGDSDVQ